MRIVSQIAIKILSWLRMELYKQAVFVKELIYRIEAKEIYDKYIRDEKATKNAK